MGGLEILVNAVLSSTILPATVPSPPLGCISDDGEAGGIKVEALSVSGGRRVGAVEYVKLSRLLPSVFWTVFSFL